MKRDTRSDRLKLLRRKKGVSQRATATSLEIPFGTYGGYEYDNDRKIPFEVLEKMVCFFGTTADYIEVGESALNHPPLTIFIDSGTQQERVAFVPVAAQAGYVKNFNEAEYLKDLPTYNLPGFVNGTYRMFPVEGDSMLPTFLPGDILICEYVEHINQMKDYECYVIVSTEGICVKRCINAVRKRRAIIIESDNQDYKPDLIPIESILEIWHYKARITRN